MARKNLIYSLQLFTAVDATVPQTSAKIVDASQLDNARIHVTHDPTSVGEFFVFARSGDKDTFVTLEFSEPLLTDAVNGDVSIRLDKIDFTDFYLTFVPSAGVGTITAVVTCKSVGA